MTTRALDAPAWDEPTCGEHPDRPARPCARCGRFACAPCFDPERPGTCAACAARLPREPPPIRGLLSVLWAGVAITALACLHRVAGSVRTIAALDAEVLSANPSFCALVALEALSDVAIAAGAGYVLLRFSRRDRGVPALLTAWLAGGVLLSAAGELALALLGGPEARADLPSAQLLRAAALGALGILYVRRSRQVRETFVG